MNAQGDNHRACGNFAVGNRLQQAGAVGVCRKRHHAAALHQALAVDVNLKGAGDVPLRQRKARLRGENFYVQPVPDDLRMAVGKHGARSRARGMEAGPCAVVKVFARVGWIVPGVNQPDGVKISGLTQVGGVKALGLTLRRGKGQA